MIIVKTKVKEYAENFNVSGEFIDELNKHVKEIVKKSCKRAEANGRRTVMIKDL